MPKDKITSENDNSINNSYNEDKIIFKMDDYIKYINGHIKKANKYYSNNDSYIIEKNNKYLYSFVNDNLKRINKIDN